MKNYPNTSVTGIGEITWPYQVLNLLLATCFLAIYCWVLFAFFWAFKNWSNDRLDRYRYSMAASLGLGLFGLALLQSGKNGYESNFFFPCVILIAILLTGHSSVQLIWTKISKVSFCFVLTISILSQVGLLIRFSPNLRTVWKQGPFLPDLSAQIEDLKSQCDLKKVTDLTHLVVDDKTYPYFWKSKEPYHALYVTGYWSVGIDHLETFLRQRKSAGYLAACHYLPLDLAVRAKRVGDLCCLPAFAPN